MLKIIVNQEYDKIIRKDHNAQDALRLSNEVDDDLYDTRHNFDDASSFHNTRNTILNQPIYDNGDENKTVGEKSTNKKSDATYK